MDFVTYNVNSITTRLERVRALLEETTPDVALLQETKVAEFPVLGFADLPYQVFDHSGGRWAGVAILVRDDLDVGEVVSDLDGAPNPDEARWLEVVVNGVRAVSVYVPNGREVGSDTYHEKLEFLDAMVARIGSIEGPIVIGGDLNICRTDFDAWDASQLHGGTHITPEERSRLEAMIDDGMVDVFRRLHPDEPGFSWWDYRFGAFHKGMGLRIDYVLARGARPVAASVGREWRKPTRVPGTKPSDHAPVFVELSMA